jgi:hypothetical protein
MKTPKGAKGSGPTKYEKISSAPVDKDRDMTRLDASWRIVAVNVIGVLIEGRCLTAFTGGGNIKQELSYKRMIETRRKLQRFRYNFKRHLSILFS